MFTAASFNNLNIPNYLKPLLANLSNHSLAKSTWSAYKTSITKLGQFGEETGAVISLPITDEVAIAFVGWLLSGGISAATVDTYLCGIRQLHLVSGLNPPLLRTPLISAIIKGKRNIDNTEKLNGRKTRRIPITPNLLKKLKLDLRKANMPSHDKHLFWAACTIGFSGGLRCGEFLNKKKLYFDPDTSLLHKHMKLKTITINGQDTEILQLTLRSEKQNSSGTPTILDIYPSDSSICPLRAFKRWQRSKNFHDDDLPAFRMQNGDNLTLSGFNRFLKNMFSSLLAGKDATISGHSLRIVLASLLGSLGYTDEEVMAAGRWSSRAFRSYLQLPRTRRLEIARAIANI